MNKSSLHIFSRIIIFITLLIVLSACNLPGTTSAPNTPPVVENLPNESTSTVPEVIPTPIVTTPAEAGNNAGSNDTTPPSITNITPDNNLVYYNSADCGSTSLNVEANISDDSGSVSYAIMQYRYNGYAANAIGDWKQATMIDLGNGRFRANINVGVEANADMKGNNGVLEYQIYTADAAGNSNVEPGGNLYGVEVENCTQAAAPSGNNPGGNNPGGNAADPLTISNIQLYPQPAVYYGNCTTEETIFNVSATIEPLDQIASATIYYAYTSSTGSYGNYSVSMYQLGIGDYSGDINVGVEAGNSLGTEDGSLEFYIQATDKSGNTVDSAWLFTDVFNCGGVLGQPPQAPPQINYFIGPNASLSPGDTYLLEWDVSGADCGVFLDGSQVSVSDVVSYSTPSDNSYQTWTHTLVAQGGDCNNPSEVDESVQIVVEAQQNTIYKGSGDIYDENSLDLGDGNGDDIIFDAQSSDTVLHAIWGAELAVYYGDQPSVDCSSYIDTGAYTTVSIATGDVVCYKTGSGNYGYLTITSMYLDLDTLANSNIGISYTTEVSP